MRPAAPPITAEDYKLLPETGPRYQLVEGDLHTAPAPNRFHQDISRNIEFILVKYLEAHPIGRVYDAPFDVYLDETNVFQPDVLFVSNERGGRLTDAGCDGAPDFVVEILSPRTARIDLDPKRKAYARFGVRELWIIDPDKLRITVYEFEKDPDHPTKVQGADGAIESPLFPGLVFSATVIFRR
jgi:Uma2 family endonuclease